MPAGGGRCWEIPPPTRPPTPAPAAGRPGPSPRPKDGEIAGAPEFRTDRFMVDGAETAGRLTVIEDLFRELGALGEMDPATLPALAARYGCEVDFQATAAIQRHGLRF
jgi:hypothetical protein